MAFTSLFERASELPIGDFVGGQYAFDFSIQVDRVSLTAIAAAVNTVLDLALDGQLTGYQIVIPSGVGEVSVLQQFVPPIVVPIKASGYTPNMRWQCISGAPAIQDVAAQVDLLMWAERLIAFPPNVIPFSGGSLVSPALSEGNVEAAVQALFAEWLGDYFDGNMHMIGVNASGVFPVCNIKFEQGEIQQPLNQADATPPVAAQTEIRLTMTRRAERRDDASQGWLITAPAMLNFWVRSKKQGRGQGAYLSRTVAELLYSILNNPENTLALAEKGIKHCHPRGAVTVPSKDWSEMMVSSGADLSWWVYFKM